MPALDHARTVINDLAADRRSRGATITADQLEAAAAFLVDLWAVAARHGVGPDQVGYALHLPRAALDTIGAARKQRSSRAKASAFVRRS